MGFTIGEHTPQPSPLTGRVGVERKREFLSVYEGNGDYSTSSPRRGED